MILNMVGSGGGGSDKSQIIVTADSGSSVTCSNRSVTKTATEKDGTWTFTGLDLGTWTITATLGEQTASKVVNLVRLSIEYVVLSYATYLYNYGDLCTDLTGGWIRKDRSTSVTVTVTEESNRLLMVANGWNDSRWVHTAEKIDLTDLSSLVFDGFIGEQQVAGETTAQKLVLISDFPSNLDNVQVVASAEITNATQGTTTLDVSDLSGEYYVALELHAGPYGDSYTEVYMYSAYLR